MGNYYISTAGSTLNTGLSLFSPWPYSKIGTFENPGDTVYLRKGESYIGTLTFSRSGSSGNRITYDLYDTMTNNAIIDGGGSTSGPVCNVTGSFINFRNIVFQNNSHLNGVIFIGNNVRDVTFYNCCAFNGLRGFYSYQAGTGGVANIVLDTCWTKGIFAAVSGGNPVGGAGSHIQFNAMNGSGVEIKNNKCYTPVTVNNANTANNGVGDIINLYQCNGTSASYMLVHDNEIRGGSSGSNGYAGLILGDLGGSYQYGYNNIFINSGRVGAQVQGGTFINMSNNKIYTAHFPYTSVGLSFGNYSGLPCNNITMGGNLINFPSADNSYSIFNEWIDTSTPNSTSTGVSGGAALATPTNWSTNTPVNTADSGAYDALLADPLFNNGDWNTVTGSGLITVKRKIHLI